MKDVERRHLSEYGFTLVELLIGMALLGLVTALILAGFRVSTHLWDRSLAHIEGFDSVRTARELLRNEIGSAYPYLVTSDPTHPHIDFDGTGTAMRFLAASLDSVFGGGRSRLSVRAIPQKGSLDLQLSTSNELATDAASANTRPEILLAGLTSLEFSYLGADEFGAHVWTHQWESKPTLPLLVRVRMSFAPSDARIWPDLLIHPWIVADVGCVFDRLTKRCQGR